MHIIASGKCGCRILIIFAFMFLVGIQWLSGAGEGEEEWEYIGSKVPEASDVRSQQMSS